MITRDTEIHWHCDYDKCRRSFTLSQNQATRYRNAEAAGTLGERRFYCQRECARAAGRDAGNERVKERLAQFRSEATAERLKAIGLRMARPKFTTENLEAYWLTVQDPTYYTELRYNYASPLSYRDKRLAMARGASSRSRANGPARETRVWDNPN